jgi:transposase
MNAFVGVDIAKTKFDVALLRQGKYRSKVFPDSAEGHQQFLAWLRTHGAEAAPVCMEATGSYFEPLACFLADHQVRVSVVNPAAVAAFAHAELSRTKTDRTDARLIARFAASQQPPAWSPPTRHIRQLRDLMRRIEDLQQIERQEQNRLDVATDTTRASIQSVLDTVQREIKTLRQLIRDHIDRHPDLQDKARLLDSIPGIGEATVAWLLAEIRFENFSGAAALAAFTGLSVRLRRSGSSLNAKPRLSKTGSSRLRRILYFPAMSACTHNPLVRAFYQRLLANGKTKKQALCAAMRKLLHIAYGVIKSGKPFNPNIALAA